MKAVYLPLMVELQVLGAELSVGDSKALLANFWVRPILVEEIHKAQTQDP